MNPDTPSCPPAPDRPVQEFTVTANADLIADGWVRRNLSDPNRADETLEMYRSMGFEVRAEKLTPADFDAKCAACALSICSSYVLIYTRKQSAV